MGACFGCNRQRLSSKEKIGKRWRQPEVMHPGAAKSQEQQRKLQSILNKITLCNFSTLVEHLSELNVDMEEILKLTIELIFQNAVSEQNYCMAYAGICFHLMKLNDNLGNGGGCDNFRSLLLAFCERAIQQHLDAAQNGADHDLISSDQELRAKAHRRFLGNMRLIGELLKFRLLPEDVMYDFLEKLLKDGQEESLEGMCTLLRSAGKMLDSEGAKSRMDEYFCKMEEITKTGQTTMRLRFILQDVLDRRTKQWRPRRVSRPEQT